MLFNARTGKMIRAALPGQQAEHPVIYHNEYSSTYSKA